jgi:hypothetical protein
MAWVQPVSVPNRTSSASVGWAAPLIIAGWLAIVHANFAAGAGRRKYNLVSRRTILQSI